MNGKQGIKSRPVAWLHTLEQVDGGESDQALSFTKEAFPMDSIGMFRSIKQAPLVIPFDAMPITKTRIGNHLAKHDNGDNTMFRNGFKDGVRFAESQHGIGAVDAQQDDDNQAA